MHVCLCSVYVCMCMNACVCVCKIDCERNWYTLNTHINDIYIHTQTLYTQSHNQTITGKLYYDLKSARSEKKIKDIALIRFEQLYPLPQKQLDALRKTYAHVTDWVWAQEEPENMGYWSHILRHLREWNLRVESRLEGASPATGSMKFHTKAQQELVDNVLKETN